MKTRNERGMLAVLPVAVLATTAVMLAGGVAAAAQGITGDASGTGSAGTTIWAASAVLGGAGTLMGWIGKQLTTGNIVMRSTLKELEMASETRDLALSTANETAKQLKEFHQLGSELIAETALMRDALYRLGEEGVVRPRSRPIPERAAHPERGPG